MRQNFQSHVSALATVAPMNSKPHESGNPFSDPGAATQYREGPPRMVPGFADLHRMTGILLNERTPDDGQVLVLGAGGGLELEYLAGVHPGWRFVGVDPSAGMLTVARESTESFADRIQLLEGYIEDAPDGPFDSAVCLLTLHFLPEAERLEALRQLRRRLEPGGPLVVAQHSFPSNPPERDLWLSRFAAFAGMPAEGVERMSREIGGRLPVLSPEQDESLMKQAGFSEVTLFYAALNFRGWVAYA